MSLEFLCRLYLHNIEIKKYICIVSAGNVLSLTITNFKMIVLNNYW